MSITTLSFDLDDTLWDPRPALVAADKAQWRRLSERYPELSEHFNRDQIFGCRKRVIDSSPAIVGDVTALRKEVMYRLLISLDIPSSAATDAVADAFSAFMAHRNDVAIFSNAEEVLGKLAMDFKIIAITNGNADVHKTALGKFFDLAIRADEVGVAKPDPEIFNIALNQAQCRASEMIHIGDSAESDVQGALNAGVTPVWFNPDGNVNRLPTAETRSLSELISVIERLCV